MRILSWNVNGLRSVGRNGFLDWLVTDKPDVLCLQETKCKPDDLNASYLAPLGYQTHWACAKKPGYSGVAIYSKTSPKNVIEGLGIEKFDEEGRVITAEFDGFVLVNAYFPNSQREHTRLPFKLEFCDAIFKYCSNLVKQGKHVVLCGDYNIAHREIDLANPKSNQNNAGFLPQERAWMDDFTNNGFVDVFRHFVKDPGHYSWWSYRPGVRERNIGWRLDYHCVNSNFIENVKESYLMPQVRGSDHCPVAIVMK